MLEGETMVAMKHVSSRFWSNSLTDYKSKKIHNSVNDLLQSFTLVTKLPWKQECFSVKSVPSTWYIDHKKHLKQLGIFVN